MGERAKHLHLAVDVGSDPITGSVAVGTGGPIGFCGWIELVAVIESVRHGGEVPNEEVWETTSGERTLG